MTDRPDLEELPGLLDGLVERLRMDAAEYSYLDEAADTLERLAAEVVRLTKENERLQVLTNDARAKSKRAGRDLLREEADAAYPHFTPDWEPLRDIAERAGVKSAAWLASRARDLQARDLIESKWIGKFGTQFKVWRLKGRPVPVHSSGPTPIARIGGSEG